MLIYPTALAEKVIGSAIKVHSALGPGLLESAYEACLVHELAKLQIPLARQVPVPIVYDGLTLECVYRADLIVDGTLLIEIKSVERLLPIHQAQAMTYLRLLRLRQGMLMNFNQRRLVDGLRNILM